MFIYNKELYFLANFIISGFLANVHLCLKNEKDFSLESLAKIVLSYIA